MNKPKAHKIDRLIELKVLVFDMMRRLEMLQNAMNQIVEAKNRNLKELIDLEDKIKNRYTRAGELVNK